MFYLTQVQSGSAEVDVKMMIKVLFSVSLSWKPILIFVYIWNENWDTNRFFSFILLAFTCKTLSSITWYCFVSWITFLRGKKEIERIIVITIIQSFIGELPQGVHTVHVVKNSISRFVEHIQCFSSAFFYLAFIPAPHS